MGRLFLIVAPLLVCPWIFSCGPPAESVEIRVGIIAPLSGPLAEKIGVPAREAALYAAQKIEQAGGLNLHGQQHHLKLLFEDDEDRAEVAVRVARKLINQDQVVALIGPFLSRNALAVAPVAENQGIPLLLPTATHPELPLGRNFVFRVTASDDLQAQVLAGFARRDLESGTAALLYDVASPYNRRFAEIFRAEYERQGGRVVASETYTTGSVDFSLPLGRIRDLAPEILVLPNYADEVPAQVRQARDLGIAATFLGGDTWGTAVPRNPGIFVGAYFVTEWLAELDHAASRDYVQGFQAAHGRLPVSLGALTHDAIGLLVAAIEQQGGLDGAAIRRRLAAMTNFMGVTGRLSYHGHGEPVRDVLVARIGKSGIVMDRRIEP